MEIPQKPSRNRRRYSQAVGRAIKLLRTEQGVERKDLADRAGISYSYLAEIENGNKPPSSSVLVVLAEALGLRPAQVHATADKLAGRLDGQTMLLDTAQPSPRRHRTLGAAAMVEPSPAMARQDPSGELSEIAAELSDEDLELVLDLARRLRG